MLHALPFVVVIALIGGGSCTPSCDASVDCGFPGITEQECVTRGCCYAPNGAGPWCQGAACSATNPCLNGGSCSTADGSCACPDGFYGYMCMFARIKTVHVVQACHLDVGFAETAVDIVNLYFDHHIPMAISVAQQLRDTPDNHGASLQFMFQSYVLSLYLNCPPDMGLHCPNASALAAFNAAAVRGDVTYHAFPFNAELEMYDPVFIDAGVQLSHSLDTLFGLPAKKTISQRDVPGMTRSVIPLLLRNNVSAISVGVNGASTPPFVPNIFLWEDPQSQSQIVAMWHPGGYGGIDVSDAVIVPGLDRALVFDWNGDNAGPYTAEQYIEHFIQIQLEFPGAEVVSSTFDNFTQYLAPFVSQLPVYNQEIGDTWIYGVPSDPKKSQMIRAMNRAWATYLQNGGMQDAVYLNATRLALKACEHTWGLDVKSYLEDNSNYSNAYFEEARVSGPFASQYNTMESSWWEQRAWGIDIPVATLQAVNHPLYQIVQQEFAQLTPWIPNPAAEGYTQVSDLGQVFQFGGFGIGFDTASGAITTFTVNGTNWSSSSNPLGQFVYRMYNQTDVDIFLAEYLTSQPPPSWAYHDFGKPNCTQSPHAWIYTSLVSLWSMQTASELAFYVQYEFQNSSSSLYGAPQTTWVQIILPASSSTPVSYNVLLLNKTSTRMPESMFLTFNPIANASTWSMDKMGEWISPSAVINGGSPHLHAIKSGVRVEQADGHSLMFSILDAPVVSMGLQNGYPIPTNQTANMDYGFSSLLYDNLWGTNYVMWWPFNQNYQPVPGEENMVLRYQLTFS